MNTTSVFVELLIIGVQAAVAILLVGLAAGASFEPALELLARFDDWTAAVTVIGLALVYTLGIVADRIADIFWAILRGWLPPSQPSATSLYPLDNHQLATAFVFWKLDEGAEFIRYHRSRLRILRASLLNGLPIAFASAWLAWQAGHELRGVAVALAAFAALAVIAKAALAVQRNCDRFLELTCRLLMEHVPTQPVRRSAVAAA